MNYEKFYAQSLPTPEQEAATVAYYRQYVADVPPPSPGARMLDVGCGWGLLMKAFQEAGFAAQGIDISPGQVTAALARGHDAIHVTDSALFLEAHAGTYDLITAFDVIEHVPSDVQLRLVHAMGQALKPGGLLLLKTPSAYSSIANVMRYGDPTHFNAMTVPLFRFLCANAGLELSRVQDEHAYGHRPSLRRPFNPNLWRWVGYRVLNKVCRAWRRLELISELGAEHAATAPLTPNLYAIARKPF